MGFSKLSKVSEDSEIASSLELVDDSVEEYCNSKFYLPSTDFNSNLLPNDQLVVQRSNSEVIAFLRTGDHIYCKECDFILTGGVGGSAGLSSTSGRAPGEKYSKVNSTADSSNPNTQSSIGSAASNSSYSNCSTVHSSAHGTASNQSTANSLTKFSQPKQAPKNCCLAGSRKDAPPADRSICILHNAPAAYPQSDPAEFNFMTIISAHQASSQKSDKQILEESIIRLFIDGKLMTGELVRLHALVRGINNSTAGPFLFDYYSDSRNLTIKQTSLKLFRDELILKLENHLRDALRDCLQKKKPIPNAIRQMLLILNNILDAFPPSSNKIRLELLCVLVVDPFVGYRGLYLNNETDEPAISSNEPEMYANKPALDVHLRKPSRPLSVQPNQMDSLNELFLNAIKKQNHRSHHFG